LRRAGLIALAVYVLCLHLVLASAILEPAWLSRARQAVRGTSGETWRPTQFWAEMIAAHRRVDGSADTGSVLVFGDSLVQGMNVNEVAENAINYGIGGDLIEGLTRRLPVYRSWSRARAVVVAIGTNDLAAHEAAAATADYERLSERVSRTVPLVMSAVLPVDERIPGCCDRFRTNGEIRKLNEGIERICAARPDCLFVDPTADLVDASGNLRPEFHEGDGLHLSPAGYRPWVSALRDAVAKAAAAPRP
jgi:lysophospholipase L1-like esterase